MVLIPRCCWIALAAAIILETAVLPLIPVRATEKVRRWALGDINWRARDALRAQVRLREAIIFTELASDGMT